MSTTPKATLRVIAYGAAGGLAAVGFMLAADFIYGHTLAVFARAGGWVMALGSLGVVAGTALIAGLLLARLQPDAAGSGIPQMKAAYWNSQGQMTLRSAAVKFVAGALSVGGGSSLGREGPSVYVGAATASLLAQHSGEPRDHWRPAALAGATAGLAAAFNAPLSGVTFVLEEVLGDLNSRLLGGVVLAAVMGALVAHAILGSQPAFAVPALANPSWRVLALAPIVAAVAALVGMAFQSATLAWRGRIRRGSRVPTWLRPLMGGLVTWAVGLGVFLATGRAGVFSLGYADLGDALRDGIAWPAAALLAFGKLPATIASYAWVGCGGIFSPLLFMGAMTGLALADAAGAVVSLTASETIILACVGMSACLGAVVRAPLTSLLIIFEMTHQFAVVPALMIGTLVSQAVARRLGPCDFYDAILEQDGIIVAKGHTPACS